MRKKRIKKRKREINQQQKRKWKKEAILRKEVEEHIKKEKKTFVASLRITYNDTGEQHTIKTRSRNVHGSAAAAANAAAPLPRWWWRRGRDRFLNKSPRQRCGSGRFLKILRSSIFFLRTLKKCMNLIEF
jgi:hypothetical protein